MTRNNIYTGAAIALALCLGSCSASDDVEQTAATEGRTPIQIGTLTVHDAPAASSAKSRAYDATNGDGFTTWQWKAGEEINVSVAEDEAHEGSGSVYTYVLGNDGTTWAVKDGQTPIYLQDVEDKQYFYSISTAGGYSYEDEDVKKAISCYSENGKGEFDDQSTAKLYQISDVLYREATLGTDKSNTATYGKISAALKHYLMDIVINIRRGSNWGETDTEADAAFKAHMTSTAVPMIYAEKAYADEAKTQVIPAGFRIKPFVVANADGSFTYRIHKDKFDTKLTGNAPILQLTTTSGSKLSATVSLTEELVDQIDKGSRLIINLVYDNLGGIRTQGVTIGKWSDGGTGDVDGNIQLID